MSTAGLVPTNPVLLPMPLTVPAALDADAPAGSRRRLVLVMALFTLIVQLADAADLVPYLTVGGLDLPLSVLPALGLAVVCGDRLLGRSTARRAAAAYWIAAGGAIAVAGVLFARTGHLSLWFALIAASACEELVFRLAIPAVIAAVLRLGGVRMDRSRVAGLVLAGLWFVLLPGHRAQMGGVTGAVPFIAFAALAATIVHRSGSVLPMAAAHSVSNLLTFLMWGDTVGSDARSMGLACVLGLLVLAYGRSRRLTIDDHGGLVDTRTGLEVASIDLRDGHPATVTLVDGRTVSVDGPLGAGRALVDHQVA